MNNNTKRVLLVGNTSAREIVYQYGRDSPRDNKNICVHGYLWVKSVADSWYLQVASSEYFNTHL